MEGAALILKQHECVCHGRECAVATSRVRINFMASLRNGLLGKGIQSHHFMGLKGFESLSEHY